MLPVSSIQGIGGKSVSALSAAHSAVVLCGSASISRGSLDRNCFKKTDKEIFISLKLDEENDYEFKDFESVWLRQEKKMKERNNSNLENLNIDENKGEIILTLKLSDTKYFALKKDDKIRERIELEAKNTSWESLHKKLSQIDPTAANKINKNDTQRITRALEIYEITGKGIYYFEMVGTIVNLGIRNAGQEY